MTNRNALATSNSNRGGYRENAGRKSSWQHPATQTIRVPKVFAQQLLKLARQLDNREKFDIETQSAAAEIEPDTDSKPVGSETVTDSILPLAEALTQARIILKAKRSARVTSARLLSAVYHTSICPDDLS